MWWNVRNEPHIWNIGLFMRACILFVSIFFSSLSLSRILIVIMIFRVFILFVSAQKQASVFKWFRVFRFWNGSVGAEFETCSHERVKCIIIFVCLRFSAIKNFVNFCCHFCNVQCNAGLMLIIMISSFLSLSRNTTY